MQGNDKHLGHYRSKSLHKTWPQITRQGPAYSPTEAVEKTFARDQYPFPSNHHNQLPRLASIFQNVPHLTERAIYHARVFGQKEADGSQQQNRRTTDDNREPMREGGGRRDQVWRRSFFFSRDRSQLRCGKCVSRKGPPHTINASATYTRSVFPVEQ